MPSTNLPVQWTSFIGRQQELADVERLLAGSGLVTLVGPGGCGKTRLAIQAAGRLAEGCPNGAWLVDLAARREPDLVPHMTAHALGLRLAPDRPALDQLLHWMETKDLLLVLDNCEHLVEACARLARQILAQAGRIRILATSRQPLAVPGEVVYSLGGLACPPSPAQPDLLQYEAVRLFVDRVHAILPGFSLTPENAAAVAAICRSLDGLPLALELASARSNILTPRQISERLNDRFHLLVASRPGPQAARHPTLAAAIDWSYDLLSPPEQTLLQRLSVFAAGCSLAAVEAVCSGDGLERQQVLDLLASLANQSLLVAHTLQRSEARYALLETIRQYAQEKLADCGAWVAARDRHLQYYLQLAESTAEKLSGPYQRMWLDWLEEEVENIRAALAWALESDPGGETDSKSGRVAAGLRIAIAIYQFWTIRDYVEEGLAWLERLLAQAGPQVGAAVRANALAYAAFLAGFRGNAAAQQKYGQSAARLAESAGEEGKPALKWALSAQAYGARAAGDFQAEYAAELRVIELNRELGDRYQLGVTLSITSFTAMALGEYAAAQDMLEESLPLLREAGNPYRIAMALNFSGDLARCQQAYARARALYQESISLLRGLGAPRDLASVLHNLGHTCLHLGSLEQADALFRESLALQAAQQNAPGMAECLIGFAAGALACGLAPAGARLLAACLAQGGQPQITTWPATRMEYEQALALARSLLTPTELQAEQAAGAALTLDQAVEYAQNLPLKALAARPPWKDPDELSVREREVAGLIARGRSNAEIASQLVVSKRTVEKHIAHILLKLGFTNRAQIVRWALESSLLDSSR